MTDPRTFSPAPPASSGSHRGSRWRSIASAPMRGRSRRRSSRGRPSVPPARGRPSRRAATESRRRAATARRRRAAPARTASYRGARRSAPPRRHRACGARGRGWRGCRTTTIAGWPVRAPRPAVAATRPAETPRIQATRRSRCPGHWRRPRGRGGPPARVLAFPPMPCRRVPADHTAGRAPAVRAHPSAPGRRAS